MATYTPAVLIDEAIVPSLGDSPIWERQSSGGAGTFDVHRTTRMFSKYTLSTVNIYDHTVSVATATPPTSSRLVNQYAMTNGRMKPWNWWVVVTSGQFFGAWVPSSSGAGPMTGSSMGYTYA